MKSETIIEVVEKLIGRIDPVGESNFDEKSYKNLEKAIELARHLIWEIHYVSRNSDRYEASMKRSGELAENFMQQLAEWR